MGSFLLVGFVGFILGCIVGWCANETLTDLNDNDY